MSNKIIECATAKGTKFSVVSDTRRVSRLADKYSFRVRFVSKAQRGDTIGRICPDWWLGKVR